MPRPRPGPCGSVAPDRLAGRGVPEPACLSSLPVTTVLPSGLNATAVTASVRNGGPMGLPVAASQSRAVLSSLPVTTALPSGLNATALTAPCAPVAVRWACRWSRPRAGRSVLAAGEYGLAVGAERHGRDRALVFQWRPDGLAGGGVPEPRRPVIAAGQHGLAVGAERHGHDRALMRRGGPMGWPVAASQSRAVLSQLPVSTVLPSGLNATAGPRPDAPAAARWACRWPRPRAAPSCPKLPVSTVLPSGLNATAMTDACASGAGRWAGRWRRPRAAPSCRRSR